MTSARESSPHTRVHFKPHSMSATETKKNSYLSNTNTPCTKKERICNMDLSNLSNNLPPTNTLEQISVADLNKDLTDEFKNAAKSVASLYNVSGSNGDGKSGKLEFANAAKAVASLYRLGSNSNELAMNKGYLECLDDLLDVIANGEDIENWALTKRAEVINLYNNKDKDAAGSAADLLDLEPTEIPTDYEFMLPLELSSNLHFRPTLSPFSVTYKRSKMKADGSRTRRTLVNAPDNSGLSDYDSDAADEDVETKKRRALQILHDAGKRRRREPPSDND